MEGSEQAGQYEQLAGVVIVVSLVIAGCTLAACVVAGLAGRKRPFSQLRLAGVPLACRSAWSRWKALYCWSLRS